MKKQEAQQDVFKNKHFPIHSSITDHHLSPKSTFLKPFCTVSFTGIGQMVFLRPRPSLPLECPTYTILIYFKLHNHPPADLLA